jgi:hypothetical protein
MQCDVLLTYPRERFVIFEDMIPHGLASIAAVLESDGLKVRVVDFTHYRGDFRKDLHWWNPKVIGIGGTTATRRGSFHIARIAKEELPDVPTVYGGVHASFTAEDTLNNVTSIDYVIQGTEYQVKSIFQLRSHRPDIPPLFAGCGVFEEEQEKDRLLRLQHRCTRVPGNGPRGKGQEAGTDTLHFLVGDLQALQTQLPASRTG